MDLRLYSKQGVRVITHHSTRNFIDIKCLEAEIGLRVTNWTNTYQYIEIRKKQNQIAMFIFMKKSDKKHAKLEWWDDAEVVYSINEVKTNN
jgi:hypothetical protein